MEKSGEKKVGIGGVEEKPTGTTEKASVSLQDRRQVPENAQPGQSAVTNQKLPRKINRAVGSKRIRGKEIQMRQNPSAERLANDESDDLSYELGISERRPRQFLVGWDSFRSKTMLVLLLLFVLWAVIYFPLILT